MESQSHTPHASPEAASQPSLEILQRSAVEHAEQKQASIESQPNAERLETKQQVPHDPALAAALPARAILPAPQRPQQDASVALPDSAVGDDRIENEWIHKAKSIVRQTKGDPYTQEDEVSKLQADYQKKRFGKDIKLASG